MLAYTIEEAQKANIFDELIVSTEDEEVSSIAQDHNMKVRDRPQSLASDEAQIKDVVRHILMEYKKEDENFDTIMILPPTSPLRIAEDIQNAYQMYEDERTNFLVSVTDYHYPPVKTFVTTEDNKIKPYWLDNSHVEDRSELFGRSQEHPDFLVDCVSIWIANAEEFLAKNTFHGEDCVGYYIPPERAVDVDNKFDFIIAELILNERKERSEENITGYDLLGGRY
jgi:CMP-N-acetylneuraminic acid synthetase